LKHPPLPAGGYREYLSGASNKPEDIQMALSVGSEAPDFTLPSHGDQKVSLSSFRGRPVVVTFMPFAFTGG
jgi:peroxiredoxin